MRKHFAACVLFLFVAGNCRAEPVAPVFADYPTVVEPSSRPIKPKLNSSQSRRYATQISTAARGKINFAGHYILAEWGCGAGCVMAAAIDSNTGKVVMLPFTVSDWPLDITEPLAYRKDGALLTVHGSRNEQGQGTYYYRFDGSAFTPVKTTDALTPPPPPSTPARRDSDTAP
ncbi:hypothetical protein [Caballeronia sp. LZ032]|uniref:hypothetical protein n=1 Tax=Caballeronia sp. LZ032 TaxID=3038565 RepID=UPI002864195F|nr:hypothetical protein [Caballeronia sp. LZ032]MDR5882102.1 hypothetical protein [Caballeronia sp. LZ032]